MWTAIGQAFSMVFEPYTLMVMVAAAFYGLFVGAVPGLTATMATALLVPVTFFMPPIPAIAAMVTATAMAIFSGDIPGCLLRIPGTPASAAYTDEAFAMTKKGQAEMALGAGLVFSAVGPHLRRIHYHRPTTERHRHFVTWLVGGLRWPWQSCRFPTLHIWQCRNDRRHWDDRHDDWHVCHFRNHSFCSRHQSAG